MYAVGFAPFVAMALGGAVRFIGVVALLMAAAAIVTYAVPSVLSASRERRASRSRAPSREVAHLGVRMRSGRPLTQEARLGSRASGY